MLINDKIYLEDKLSRGHMALFIITSYSILDYMCFSIKRKYQISRMLYINDDLRNKPSENVSDI